MKNYNHIVLFLTLFLTQVISLQAQINLVQNGSFETVDEDGTPTGWTLGSTDEVAYSIVSGGYEGSNAFQVDVASENTLNFTRFVIQEITDIEIGAAYDVSFQYKVLREPAGTDGGMFSNIGTSDATGWVMPIDWDIAYIPLVSVFDTWVPYVKEDVVIPEGAVSFVVELNFNRGINVLIDDIQIVKKGNSDIRSIKASLPLPVYKDGKDLVVTAEAGSVIEVMSIAGVTQQKVISNGGKTTISGLPQGRVLIVRSGSTVAKVML
ncbi:MAG: hypothetical protein LBR52_07215 [Prevotellaceae bacterium]|nr:hypothetical protein [Prevotellaceae bacterium]